MSFTESVVEWSEFCLIRWNFREFFAGGQASENKVYWMNKWCEFSIIRGIFVGELHGICVICWKFWQKTKRKF